MSTPKTYKWCIVPKCVSTTVSSPEKLFFKVPFELKMRKKWMRAIKRDHHPPSNKSSVYCCEDHFDVENDMENYIKFKLVGGRIQLKKGVVPSRFQCQRNTEEKPERSAVDKRNQIKYFEKILNEDPVPLTPVTPEEIFVMCDEKDNKEEDPLRLENDPCMDKSKRHKAIQVRIKNQVENKATITQEKFFKKRKNTKKETDANDDTVSATQLVQDPSPDNDNMQVMENQQQQQYDTNNTQSRVGTHDQRSRKRSKKRPTKDIDDLLDQTLSDAFRILQQCAELQPSPQPPCDSYSEFGKYIANELRKYDPVTLAHVKKDICGRIFQADTGACQQYGYYTQSYASSYTDSTSPSPLPPEPPISPRPSTHISSYTDPMPHSSLPPQPPSIPFSMTSSIHSEIPLSPSPPMTSQHPLEIPPPRLAPKYTSTKT